MLNQGYIYQHPDTIIIIADYFNASIGQFDTLLQIYFKQPMLPKIDMAIYQSNCNIAGFRLAQHMDRLDLDRFNDKWYKRGIYILVP